jgi:hypothetical protein
MAAGPEVMDGEHLPQPVVPDYAGANLVGVVPALLEQAEPRPLWVPECAAADQVVLLVLDGLGWEQLQDRRHLAPTLAAMAGGPITTVAPSTTATALTSLTTSLPPGDHGVVGYRMHVGTEVLNVLRWSTPAGDSRKRIVPESMQPHQPFGGQRPPVVTRADFLTTGFTAAHLSGVRFVGYRMASTLVTEVARLARSGEPFVYAYYEGIDKISHEYGLGEHYDAELRAADRLVADLLEALPPGTALAVTADHGQVDCGDRIIDPAPEVLAHVRSQSGEGRFRWLHAEPGQARALQEAAAACHGDVAWVKSRKEIENEGWFGPRLSPDAAARLGDVALVCHQPVSFHDPADGGLFELVGRHGSLTAAEMLVPFVATVA